MKKSMFLLLLISISQISITGFGQATGSAAGGMIYLNQNSADSYNSKYERGYYVGPHVLGEDVTRLMNEFEEKFTYYLEGDGAYAVKEKIVEKPALYKAVKKVVKHYEKLYKKNKITANTANDKLTANLELAIKLLNYDTERVESDLKKLKAADEIEAYLVNLGFKG